MQNTDMSVSNWGRFCVAMVFIYHGLVPKILWLDAVEIKMITMSGISIPAQILSPVVGVGEILLGVLILFWRSSLLPVYAAFLALASLLVAVAVIDIALLKGAFNPVTTNFPVMLLCYFIVLSERHARRNTQR